MTNRTWTGALLIAGLLLGGCAAGEADSAGASTDAHAHTAAGHPPGHATTAAQDAPPELAAMVCDGDVADGIAGSLSVDGALPTDSTWADGVFTCTYDLPYGPLVLRVNVSDDDAGAQAFFAARRAELPDAEELIGLGEQAYGTPAGTLVVVKDDMTL